MRNPILAGALAGLAATVPMTLAMELMYRQLPPRQRYPLPPRLITQRLARRARRRPPRPRHPTPRAAKRPDDRRPRRLGRDAGPGRPRAAARPRARCPPPRLSL